MSTLPWPTQAAWDGSRLPWIPPPPIYGLPQGTPPSNESPYFPHYFANVPRPGEPTAAATGDAVGGYAQGREPWPRPADLPLPSVFPLPPSMLPSPDAKGLVMYPPPFPNGWWAVPPPPHLSHTKAADKKCNDEEGDDAASAASSSSCCSSCSECARHQSPQEPRRATAQPSSSRERHATSPLVRSQSAPSPLPRQQRKESIQERSRPRQAVAQPQRFVSVASEHAPIRVAAPSAAMRSARSASTPRQPSNALSSSSSLSTSSVASQRLEVAAAQAEALVARIEELYQKLRANYETIQRDPDSFMAATGRPTAAATPHEPPKALSRASQPSPAPRLPATPATAPPSTFSRTNTASAVTAPATAAFAASSGLREQLLKLESQWKRLEEMKHRSNTADFTSAPETAPTRREEDTIHTGKGSASFPSALSSQGNTTAGMVSSSASSSGGGRQSAAGAAAPPPTVDFGNSAQVLQLIRERKAAVRVS